MAWKIAIAKLATRAGMKALEKQLDKLTTTALRQKWHLVRAVEVKNETEDDIKFTAGKSRQYTIAGAYTEAPDGTTESKTMEVFGLRTGPNRSYSGITTYRTKELTIGIQMHFGATLKPLGIYPYSMFVPNRMSVFLGPRTSSPLKKADRKYWKKSRGLKSSVSTKYKTKSGQYELLGIVGDRAYEFTLSKL